MPDLLSAPTRHILHVPATTRHLSEIRDFIALYSHRFGFSETEIQDIQLAVDEAYTNIVTHAYHNDLSQMVRIELGGTDHEFRVSLVDSGDSFDPETWREPDIPQNIHDGKRGGVGVYLIRQLMDSVEYRKNGGRNEISMRKTPKRTDARQP